MEAGLDTMTDQSQTIIDDNPIGNGLDNFRSSYEEEKDESPDAFGQGDEEGNTIPLYCSIFL
jgi:hypothetical protein